MRSGVCATPPRVGIRRTKGPRPALVAAFAALALVAFPTACGEPEDAGGEPERLASAEPLRNAQPSSSDPAGERPAALRGRGFEGMDLSRDAQQHVHDMLRADQALPRHVSDGQGRGRIERIETPGGEPLGAVVAGSHARFHLLFEAGPNGVADGGYVFLQASPFWRWGWPQFERPDAPGFTTVALVGAEAEPTELRLATTTYGEGLAGVQIRGRALSPGETLRFVYGAGPLGVRVDDHAEREERIWFMVDGDGDGMRRLVEDSPTLTVLPSVPAHLVLTVPTTARRDEPLTLTAAVLDLVGNRGVPTDGQLELELPAQLEGPTRVPFTREDRGLKRIELRATAPGIYRIAGRFEVAATEDADASPSEWGAEAPRSIEASAGPLVVGRLRPVLWADLHGHTSLSDGTGTPEDYYAYARDVAGLDVAALTDHDHWGLRFLDERPDLWARIQSAVAAAHDPGRFVALLGYEWTSWLHGHRHVLYFEPKVEDGEVFSSIAPETETPALLWKALRGRKALTFAHHSAGGPVSTNWSYAPDPILEPVTEIASVHGSSEAPDTPVPIYSAVPGNAVRDALDAGYRLGLIGSGDSHDGHPGLAHVGAPSGVAGLAALVGADHTRESVLGTLRSRSVYATNGPRIWLRTTLDGRPMGSLVPAPESADEASRMALRISVAATAPIATLDVIGPDGIGRIATEGGLDWSGAVDLPPLEEGEYLYVRVVQEDSGAAWSSPYFCCAP